MPPRYYRGRTGAHHPARADYRAGELQRRQPDRRIRGTGIVPDRSPRDHNWLRDALKKTGATINVIRKSAGLGFQTVNDFMSGISMIHDQNYDTLAAWVNGGAKCQAVEKKPAIKEKEEPQVGMERMLDIIEGRAGIAPETSLGPGYRTSSTLSTYQHYDMPARNQANKYMQY